MTSAFGEALLPPVTRTETGALRRVGVEIEFINVEIGPAAELVVAVFGGKACRDTDYEIRVSSPEVGEFRVEVDFAFLRQMGQERSAAQETPGLIERVSEELLAAIAQQVVPCEIVTPPLPFEKLAELNLLVARLREAGARGTDEALLYAFGVHFNPEAPSLCAESILAYLRTFVLLYDWLKDELQVDTSRRLLPFIRAFPVAYVQILLEADYRPEITALIDDYLIYNPTRNRAMDMLPLFAYLDRERVFAAVKDPRIHSRPTYHYRLSNSRVGDPRWRLTDDWRYWLVVEALAQNPEKLSAMAADYRAVLNRPLGDVFSTWVKKTRQWLDVA